MNKYVTGNSLYNSLNVLKESVDEFTKYNVTIADLDIQIRRRKKLEMQNKELSRTNTHIREWSKNIQEELKNDWS